MLYLLKFIILISLNVDFSLGHGRLMDPVARSSAWRKDPKNFPAYYNDMEMFCGGAGTQWNQNGGKCGICGENYMAKKEFEKGGSYYTGQIVRTYQRGQTINVHVELTANHLGSFEFKICNVDGLSSDATQECLDNNILANENGLKKFPVSMGQRDIYIDLVLPNNIICNHCVFQWKYNTSNSFGIAVEQFYGCSDISVLSDGNQIITTTTPLTTRTSSSNVVIDITTSTQVSSTSRSTNSITSSSSSISTSRTTNSITSTSSSTSRTTSLTTNFEENNDGDSKCYNGDGFYADVENGCQRYYICVFSHTRFEQVTYFDCPEFLLFDAKLKLCNLAKFVKCETD